MQSLLSAPEREEVIDYCFSRYGVQKDCWTDYDLIKKKEGLWLIPKYKHSSELLDYLLEHGENSGLRVLSGKRFPYKVTSQFYQVFHKEVTKGTLSVTEEQGLKLLKRKTLEDQEFEPLAKGYYCCLFKEKFFGIALKATEGLVSQVPKSLTAQLAKDLKLSDE